MKAASIATTIALSAAGFMFLFAQQAAAQATPVRVIASNGVKAVLDDVRPQCERAIGHPLSIEFGTTAGLMKQIEAGEAFDVVILTAEATDALIKEGKIAAETRSGISRIGIGVGIRAGAPKPDIHTPEAMKRTLLKAKSITYAKEGASRPTIDKMIARLGIADTLKPKTMMLDGAAQTAAAVSEGRTELLITLISEIVSAPGVDYAGPLPGDLQNYVNFAAGVSATSKNRNAGEAVIKFLTARDLAPLFKAKGMETR